MVASTRLVHLRCRVARLVGYGANPRAHVDSFKISPDARADAQDDSLVVLDIFSGHLFRSNRTGSLIWRGLAANQSLESIALELTSLCGIPSTESLRSVAAYLLRLRHLGLVVPVAR